MIKNLSVCLWLLVFSFWSAPTVAADSDAKQGLGGLNITYEYTSGRSYNVKFDDKGISYRYLTGSKPDIWWGPFPYQSFVISERVFFTSWFEQDYGDYVTLLINLNDKILHGSAILRGEEVHFHSARIIKIQNHEND